MDPTSNIWPSVRIAQRAYGAWDHQPVDPTASSNDDTDFVHRNVIPRTSHEGIQFDSAVNMYFIDELNGGSLYKFRGGAPGRGDCW